MLTIWRTIAWSLFLTALPGRAFGLATEHHGNAPIGVEWRFLAGVVAVANLPSRVYWREINGDPQFFFRGNTTALNQALEVFAKIEGPKEILLLPGPSDVRTLVERKPVPCDWDLRAPDGFYIHFARQEKGTDVMIKHPRLTIYVNIAGASDPADAKQVEQWINQLNSDQFPVREKATKELQKLGRSAGAYLRKAKENRPGPEQLRRIDALLDKLVGIDLEQIGFPAGVKVLCSKDLRDRYLEGLKSDNGEIRGHAIGGLGEMARFTDDVIPPILEALKSDKHEYVRRYAASTLGGLGKRSTAALPTLKAGLKDPDVNIRNAFQAAIDLIENPKEEQPSPEQLKQRQVLADEIQKLRAVSKKREIK